MSKMWTKIFVLSSLIIGTFAQDELRVKRYISDGVRSAGYKVVYGDEDLVIVNEVVSDMEKANILKKQVNVNEALPPLPEEDVKCMMSADRYCSPEMLDTKEAIIQAIKDDCKQCTTDQKEKAGKVIATMMAHNLMGWKLFLKRSALIIKPTRKSPPKQEKFRFKVVGQPEEVPRSKKYSYIMPGVKVRVRRYAVEKL